MTKGKGSNNNQKRKNKRYDQLDIKIQTIYNNSLPNNTTKDVIREHNPNYQNKNPECLKMVSGPETEAKKILCKQLRHSVKKANSVVTFVLPQQLRNKKYQNLSTNTYYNQAFNLNVDYIKVCLGVYKPDKYHTNTKTLVKST